MRATRKSSKGIASWRESRACQKPGGMAGDSPAPGRQPAAPYGRKPTGRGTAAGRLSPHPQAASPFRNAPTMTAPAELTGLTCLRRACSRHERSQPGDRPGRAAVRARIEGGFAACSYRVRRAWYGAAPPASSLLQNRSQRSGGLTPEPLRPLRAECAGRPEACP